MANSYRHTVKATIIMSSAQVVEAVFSLIRAKIISVLLGPVGVGMNSIFQTTLNTLYQFTSLGLPQSAVRDISQAHNEEGRLQLARITSIFSYLMRLLAIGGLIICIALSPMFSDTSFGRKDDHTSDFIILSIGAAAMVLSYANITILQGTKRLLSLAKTTMLAAVISLGVGIPFYYYMDTSGIAWAISLGYATTLCINSYYVRQIRLPRVHVRWREIWIYASPMIKLGIIIMVSSLIINIFNYSTNVLIRYFGSLEDVGLFQAGNSITTRNFSILSAALVADYYPRLSGLLGNRQEFNKTVSEQGEILMLIISFMSMLLIIFAPWIIRLLLTEEFLVIRQLVQLIAYSFVFRITWLTLSYIALARGDKKVYLIYDAIIGNGGYTALNIVFYYLWGINGIGISCIIGSIFVSLLLLIVYGRKYRFRYSSSFWKVQIGCVAFLTLIMAFQYIPHATAKILTESIVCLIFSVYIYLSLDKRIQLRQFIKNKLHI